jgi:hypothetical protein
VSGTSNQGGASLDEILDEAFAVVREASFRVLGLRHYDVQLVGGMALHDGKLAEMSTGEGKTLVASLASYLNALEGKGVHVVTVNDYLARRDSENIGQVRDCHQFLTPRSCLDDQYWSGEGLPPVLKPLAAVWMIKRHPADAWPLLVPRADPQVSRPVCRSHPGRDEA